MKTVLFILAPLLFTLNVQAQSQLSCAAFAESEAAKYSEMPLSEFRAEFSVIWSCKFKVDPTHEEIQFGDGSSLVGVPVQLQNGQCVLSGEVYSGQDDNDADLEWHEENCLTQ